MTFGDALENAKIGKTITRETWTNKKITCNYTSDFQSYLEITINNSQPVPYYRSNEDIFANDWIVI